MWTCTSYRPSNSNLVERLRPHTGEEKNRKRPLSAKAAEREGAKKAKELEAGAEGGGGVRWDPGKALRAASAERAGLWQDLDFFQFREDAVNRCAVAAQQQETQDQLLAIGQQLALLELHRQLQLVTPGITLAQVVAKLQALAAGGAAQP